MERNACACVLHTHTHIHTMQQDLAPVFGEKSVIKLKLISAYPAAFSIPCPVKKRITEILLQRSTDPGTVTFWTWEIMSRVGPLTLVCSKFTFAVQRLNSKLPLYTSTFPSLWPLSHQNIPNCKNHQSNGFLTTPSNFCIFSLPLHSSIQFCNIHHPLSFAAFSLLHPLYTDHNIEFHWHRVCLSHYDTSHHGNCAEHSLHFIPSTHCPPLFLYWRTQVEGDGDGGGQMSD